MNTDDRAEPDVPAGDGKSSADEPKAKSHDPSGRNPAPEGKGLESRRQPSMMRSLLLPGLVALVSGIVGALSYLYFFDPSRSDGQSASTRKSDSGSTSKSLARFSRNRVATDNTD